MSDKTCKTCKWWRPWGEGTSGICAASSTNSDANGIHRHATADRDGTKWATWPTTGPDFGCIHHEEKDG